MDIIASGGKLQGEINLPGDKSISHRALILGSLAKGQTIVNGLLTGKDCLATLDAMRQLGVHIEQSSGTVHIEGVGLQGLKAVKQPIDCGNSGTALRLLAGVLAGRTFDSTLQGDNSLNSRPMERIVVPLTKMGARIDAHQRGAKITAPLTIHGNPLLQGIDYSLPIASAQVKSCLLFAGLSARGKTHLVEHQPTRDHTERLLQAFGADIQISQNQILLTPGKILQGQEITIPGDLSSAAFFIVGATLAKGSHLILRNVGVNPRRTGILLILQKMGANIRLFNDKILGNEPVADIEITSAPLRGIEVPMAWVVSAIDEFPIIFIAAAFAQGKTIIRGIEELRYKETDRIEVMAKGLADLGVKLEVMSDGIMIQGSERIAGDTIESAGDHRVAMAFAISSILAKEPLRIKNCDNIATSFPNFSELANQLGLSIRVIKTDE